jgi:hypothetical protein
MREKEEREGVRSQGFGTRRKVPGYLHRVNQISTSFFITNFPEELGWGEIWKIFAKFGSVSDVFIPKKVDKWGRKFGFVKFKEVRDVEELTRRLEDVWHGQTKFSVKRARFGPNDPVEEAKVKTSETTRKRVAVDVRVIEDVSFKTMLVRGKPQLEEEVGGVGGGGEKEKNRLHCVKDLAPLELGVCASTLRSLERSMVGFLKNSVDFHTFNDRLLLEGHHEVKAIQMGGNLVLLQSACDGELREVMNCNKVWWEFCFSKVIPWKPNLLSESREIWIQIYGLPLHAWEEGSFKAVAGRFGVFLDFDEDTIAKNRFDVARVKLRTVRRHMIDTVVQLSVWGSFFDVWVVEERCGCREEERYEEEGSLGNSGGASKNSGEEVWQGQKGDLFSDGTSDSDQSEPYKKQVVDLHLKSGSQGVATAVDSADADFQEGSRNDTVPCQSLLGEPIGEKGSERSAVMGQVGDIGDGCLKIPKDVGEMVLGCSEEWVDVSGSEEHEVCHVRNDACCEVEGRGVPLAITGQVFEKPSPDPLEQMGLGLDLDVGSVDQTPILSTGEVQVASDEEGGFLKDQSDADGGAQMVFSDLSISTQEISKEWGRSANRKNSKKLPSSKNARAVLPLVGAPLSMQIALNARPAGRRRKVGDVVRKGGAARAQPEEGVSSSPPVVGNSFSAQSNGGNTILNPNFELHVVLPFPDSGVAHLVDGSGEGDSDTEPAREVDVSTEEAVVTKLIEIQKKVGFTFEGGEEDIHSRLVVLEKKDSEMVGERVNETSYQ